MIVYQPQPPLSGPVCYKFMMVSVENRLKDDFNNVIEKRESKSITWADVVSNKNKSQKEESINEEDTNKIVE